jgi:hypothetical protein
MVAARSGCGGGLVVEASAKWISWIAPPTGERLVGAGGAAGARWSRQLSLDVGNYPEDVENCARKASPSGAAAWCRPGGHSAGGYRPRRRST